MNNYTESKESDIEVVEDAFAKAQQELVDNFKLKLEDAAKVTLSKLYTDVTNFAATDAHTNYHNFLRDEFRDSLKKEISSEHGHYSWAHGIRMELLNQHADVLRTTIITDLQGRIKSLEEHVRQLQERR